MVLLNKCLKVAHCIHNVTNLETAAWWYDDSGSASTCLCRNLKSHFAEGIRGDSVRIGWLDKNVGTGMCPDYQFITVEFDRSDEV
jgi:hypothetical protein